MVFRGEGKMGEGVEARESRDLGWWKRFKALRILRTARNKVLLLVMSKFEFSLVASVIPSEISPSYP